MVFFYVFLEQGSFPFLISIQVCLFFVGIDSIEEQLCQRWRLIFQRRILACIYEFERFNLIFSGVISKRFQVCVHLRIFYEFFWFFINIF